MEVVVLKEAHSCHSHLLLGLGDEVLVDIVVRATGDGKGNTVVEDNGEGVMDGIDEDGVEVGDIGVLVVGGGIGNITGVGLLLIEEAEEEISGLGDSNGTEPGAEGNDDTVGEVLVVSGSNIGGVSLLEHLVHHESELDGGSDGHTGEEDVSNHVDGLGETEEVTDEGVVTVGLEGGTGEVAVRGLDTDVDGGGTDPDGGEDTGDDADEATSGGVEDGNAVLEGLLTVGAEETPEAGGTGDEERSEVVVRPLGVQVVEERVELGPVEAGIEDAGLGGILSSGARAVSRDGGAIRAAGGVVEEGLVTDLLDEVIDVGEAVTAGTAEGE